MGRRCAGSVIALPFTIVEAVAFDVYYETQVLLCGWLVLPQTDGMGKVAAICDQHLGTVMARVEAESEKLQTLAKEKVGPIMEQAMEKTTASVSGKKSDEGKGMRRRAD